MEKPFADLSRLLLRELRHEDMGAYLLAVEDSKGQVGEEGWPKKRPPRSYANKQGGDGDDDCEGCPEDTFYGDEEVKTERPLESMRPTEVTRPMEPMRPMEPIRPIEHPSRHLEYLTVGRV